jgi:hypothetical protein
MRIIEAQAEANGDPAISKQRNFAKYIDSDVGKELFWAMKATPADGVADAAERHVDFIKTAADLDTEDYVAKRAELDGENHARLHSMAVDMQRGKPGLSYEMAFSRVYTDSKNRKIADGAKAEHLSRALTVSLRGAGDSAFNDRISTVGNANDYKNPHPTRVGSPRAGSGTRV